MILVCHCCVKILHASNWNSACVPTHTCQFKGMLRHPRGDILETSQTCSCISYDLRSNSGLAVSRGVVPWLLWQRAAQRKECMYCVKVDTSVAIEMSIQEIWPGSRSLTWLGNFTTRNLALASGPNLGTFHYHHLRGRRRYTKPHNKINKIYQNILDILYKYY